jgi:DNA-binding NarL/FixJ family response regulator
VVSQGEMAQKVAREIGQRSGEAYALIGTACCLGSRGDYSRALDEAQRGLAIAQEIDHRLWMTAAHCILGALYCDVFALSTAQKHFEQALELAHEVGSLYWIRTVTDHLVSTYILQHELVQAESILGAVLDPHTPTQTTEERMIWCARAELALAHGDPNRTISIVEQMMASAVNVSSEQDIPHLSKLRGEALIMLHRTAEAEASLQAAQAGAMAQGRQPLLWRIAIDLGKLYQAQRRNEEAARAFATARELIEELAAPIPDLSLRAHFLQQATALLPRQKPLSPRRAAGKAFGGLTQREREVASLIAQGKANREIADILVVNYRTIEAHVSNILSKLGFSSRAQIAVWATEKGLGKHAQSQL